MSAPNTPSEAIIGRLLAQTTIVGTRIFPVIPTQDDATPGDYVVVTKTGGGGGMRLGSPTILNQYSMRVDAYSATEAQAEAILAACVEALSGWVDRANRVNGCFPTEDADEQIAEDVGGGTYKVSGQTFSLWFQG